MNALAAAAPRRIGPFLVPPIGFGCMNLSHAYGTPPPPEVSERLLLAALDAGVTMFDTAALYGFGANETLVGRVLAPHRAKIVLCSKGGISGVQFADGKKRVIDARPASLRRDCEASLQRLRTDVIDLYYLHRWDKSVPVEDSIGEIARLVAEGKVRAVGMSEVSAATLRRGHAVHPIAAVQTEYSLWTRNPEIAVLEACRAIGAAFVAFSPTARGLFSDAPPDIARLDPKDLRLAMPRFTPAHWARNLALRAPVAQVAAEVGCTLAQLAIAWVLARGEQLFAIPGTTRPDHLHENLGAAAVRLSAAQLARLDEIVNPRTVSGPRYNEQNAREVDTEEFD